MLILHSGVSLRPVGHRSHPSNLSRSDAVLGMSAHAASPDVQGVRYGDRTHRKFTLAVALRKDGVSNIPDGVDALPGGINVP
jgi:hypothetical protein